MVYLHVLIIILYRESQFYPVIAAMLFEPVSTGIRLGEPADGQKPLVVYKNIEMES